MSKAVQELETSFIPNFKEPFSSEMQASLKQLVLEQLASLDNVDSFQTEEWYVHSIDQGLPLFPADRKALEEGYTHRLPAPIERVTDSRVVGLDDYHFGDAQHINQDVVYYFAPDGRVAVQRSFTQSYGFVRDDRQDFLSNLGVERRTGPKMTPTHQRRLDLALTQLDGFEAHPDLALLTHQRIDISRIPQTPISA